MPKMSARSIASGTVSFGLVSIPVKLYSATEPQSSVSFHMLHEKCGTRVKQQYICPAENVKVERQDMVKGYEFAKDQYVTFTPEELKALEEKATSAIEISEFLPAVSVDPIYFDKCYYLGPDKGGAKAYTLLIAAMLETERVALARYAARGKQSLVLVRPFEKHLLLQQLLYNDEVRPATEIPTGEGQVKDAELKLAKQFIDQMSADEFHPEHYKDEVRERILASIEKKVAGEEIVHTGPPEAAPAQIIDLMEALKASLESGGKSGRGHGKDAHAEKSAERKPAKRAGSRTGKSSDKDSSEEAVRPAKRAKR